MGTLGKDVPLDNRALLHVPLPAPHLSVPHVSFAPAVQSGCFASPHLPSVFGSRTRDSIVLPDEAPPPLGSGFEPDTFPFRTRILDRTIRTGIRVYPDRPLPFRNEDVVSVEDEDAA